MVGGGHGLVPTGRYEAPSWTSASSPYSGTRAAACAVHPYERRTTGRVRAAPVGGAVGLYRLVTPALAPGVAGAQTWA